MAKAAPSQRKKSETHRSEIANCREDLADGSRLAQVSSTRLSLPARHLHWRELRVARVSRERVALNPTSASWLDG